MAALSTKATNGTITVEQLIELKRFADGFGGVAQVQRGLETLARFS